LNPPPLIFIGSHGGELQGWRGRLLARLTNWMHPHNKIEGAMRS